VEFKHLGKLVPGRHRALLRSRDGHVIRLKRHNLAGAELSVKILRDGVPAGRPLSGTALIEPEQAPIGYRAAVAQRIHATSPCTAAC
jgi:hypothetical protein